MAITTLRGPLLALSVKSRPESNLRLEASRRRLTAKKPVLRASPLMR